ncbi:putative RNA export mediator protein, partial [Diaporthe sp. PMI_573]
SPASSSVADFLSPDRNSETNHKDALAAAAAEHERIRAKAELLLEQARQQWERARAEEANALAAQEKIKAEQQRLRAEQAAREEQERLREIAAKKVPPLPPLPTPKPERQPTAPQPQPPAFTAAPTPAAKANPAPAAQPGPQLFSQPNPPNAVAFNGNAAPKPPISSTTAAPTPGAPSVPVRQDTKRQRAVEIHKNLKQLRAAIASQSLQNKPLKSKAGDLRRELRKVIGQLSLDKDGNRMQKVTKVLKDGLANEVGSQMVDPSLVVFTPRQPVEGAVHNAELPSLFLFLLNHLAKAILNQFISEAASNTKTADPVGVCAAAVFSDPIFQWRGQPLIDILIAKFHVICPVLFGARGSEKTDQGRDLVGWKRRGTAWVPETEHMDRMTGLAAGYAAIALRDFSKAKKQNPYPMPHYWESMAKIVNTPPQQMSVTQCVVLRSMIDHHEARFLQFYGSAAIAALRLALVDFPAAAAAAGLKDNAVQSLAVHAEILKTRVGLNLA